MEVAGKLVDLMLGGISRSALGLIPPHLRKEAIARLQDVNPFRRISTNHDLVRAVRLSWIEAALRVLEPVAAIPAEAAGKEAKRFSALLREVLLAERLKAFDRTRAPETSPIDRHVQAVLAGTPEYITSDPGLAHQASVTQGFVSVLAELTGWDEKEIPPVFGRVATDGVRAGNRAVDFGELVFVSFAELIKSKDKYPEAQTAFHVSMMKTVTDVAESTLAAVRNVDAKLNAALAGDALQIWQAGTEHYLKLLPELSGKMDAVLERQERQIAEQAQQTVLLA